MLRLLHGLVWLVAALRRRATARFGAFLDPAELLTPEALERAGPLVQGPERPGVRAIEHPTSVATCPHETDVAQHAQMLRDRRLRQSERSHDLAHRALVGRQKVEDRPAPGFCDSVERIRARGGARHCLIIFLYGNVSRRLFTSAFTQGVVAGFQVSINGRFWVSTEGGPPGFDCEVRGQALRDTPAALFIAEGDHGIHARRAPCGNISGESRHSGESKGDSCERGWVTRRDAEEHVAD